MKIAERFRPFSHTPGVKCLVPGTEETVQIFPTRWIHQGKTYVLPLSQVEQFLALLDLEKGAVIVSGKAKTGFFRYHFSKKGFQAEKGVESEPVPFLSLIAPEKPFERLSHGVTKALEWEKLIQRKNPEEFLPVWFFYGNWFPKTELPKENSLLEELHQAITNKDRLRTVALFTDLFTTGFSNLFHPENIDLTYSGLELPPLPQEAKRSLLLSCGKELIRSLHLEETNDQVTLLPLPLYPSGRMTDLSLSFGTVSIEWTKERLRKVLIKPSQKKKVTLVFPKELKQCRLNKEPFSIKETTLDFLPNRDYFFDQFER